MSTPMAETTRNRRARRRFDDDFKAQAVRLVLDEGKSVGAVARDLDLTETALREWVTRARADRTKGWTGLTNGIQPVRGFANDQQIRPLLQQLTDHAAEPLVVLERREL